MTSKRILIISQVIPQWYVDVLTAALPADTTVDIITGSTISNSSGEIFLSPAHDATSFLSRLKSWFNHKRFVKKWIKKQRGRRYELIFATSNPPINSYIGLKLKKAFHAPFLFMNWDLYPQCIDYMIRNPLIHLICKCWHGWNSRNYPKIDHLLTIGDTVAQSINQDLKHPIDISVIPIAVNTDRMQPIPCKDDNLFCTENGLQNKFIVLYSGKMGYGHNIELILSAAEILRGQDGIEFVFVGEGQKAGCVAEYIAQRNATNVRLFPLQPDEMFRFSMACGDVGIVSEEAKMAHLFMPSKTYSMLACGMPVIGICTENDDLHNTIEKHAIGFCVTNGNAEALASHILTLYQNTELLQQLKLRARESAKAFYSLPVITEQYRSLFQKYL